MTRRALETAHKLMKDGDLDAADASCVSVLETDPKQPKAHQLRALIALERGDIASAHTHILAALKLAPQDAECLNTYGNTLKFMGRTLEAIEAYKKSLKAAPNYIQAARHLGELYLNTKNPVQAADVFQTALTHHEGHPGLMRGLLYAMKDCGQTEAAQQLLGQIPPAPDLALTAGQLFAQTGQNMQARAAFSQALSHPPTAVLAFRNLMQIMWRKEGREATGAAIHKMVEASPEAGFIYIEGADLFWGMGDPAAGIALLDQCEAKFGEQPDIDLARAKILIETGDGPKALSLASRALSARQGDLSMMAAFARAALMCGEFKQALQAAKAVQARMPGNQFWIAIEATAVRGLGDTAHSLNDYERLVQIYDLDAPPEYKDMADFLSQLKTDLAARHDSQHHPLGQSLRQGTQTSADLRFADSRVIQDFFQALDRPIQNYMNLLDTLPDTAIAQRNGQAYRLSGAWSVLLKAGGFHVNHVHPEGWISSAFYVDVPDGTDTDPDKKGWIKFGEPPFAVPGLGPEHVVAPKPGRLVLFPSYMWHGTLPIGDGASRMTLPFDVVPA